MVCYNCFREKSSYGPCPFCGYDPAGAEEKYPLALKQGSILNGRYTVGRVIGQGGFGITYISQDYQTRERVAIKEYFPSEFAGRSGLDSSIQVHSKDQRENFEYGKAQFLEEAKTLAAFIGDEYIVRIYSYFEENNTAYFVMEYVDGYALDQYMAQKGGRLSVDEANRLLLPLMQSLDKVHAKGIIHRDIAPDNIIVTKDGNVKLIDFGAARYSTGEKSKSLDVILKHGFAPKEQYLRRGRQGPFTDIYALAATYYYAITGKVPPESIERMDDDNLIPPSSLGVKLSGKTEDVLFNALEVNAPDRYQSMAEFQDAMKLAAAFRQTEKAPTPQNSVPDVGVSTHKQTVHQEKPRLDHKKNREEKPPAAEQKKQAAATKQAKKSEATKQKSKSKKKPLIAVIVATLIVAVAVGYYFSPQATAKRHYEKGILLQTERQYNEAIAEFEAAGDYEDAAAQIHASYYAEGHKLKEDGDWGTASEAFTQAGDYKDAPQQALFTHYAQLFEDAEVGDVVFFGNYEQDNDLTNGKEPIAWRVLDFQDGKHLLISENALDFQAYYDGLGTEPSWETSTLRAWLNNDFLNTAFTKTEQDAIQTSTVDNSRKQMHSNWNTSGGINTQDKVYLLSYTEANDFFESDPDRVCEATPFVLSQGTLSSNDTVWWWLRSPGYTQANAARVGKDGVLSYSSYHNVHDLGAVRPAMWIDIDRLLNPLPETSENHPEPETVTQQNDIKTVGSIIAFGSYEQDNNPGNGKEPIEWKVLDVHDGKSLLISQYVLDSQSYNTQYEEITWETCALRRWLNEAFLTEAFSPEERFRILSTTVKADPNPNYSTDPGNNSIDQVFVLSINEANSYFLSDTARQCTATAYAESQGVLNPWGKNKGSWWWLRSPGSLSQFAACVYLTGEIDDYGQGITENYNHRLRSIGSVRPAMWVNWK